jgi:hypothetical protein
VFRGLREPTWYYVGVRRSYTLSLDPEFVRRVDVSRGLVSRSRWIEALLERPARVASEDEEASRHPLDVVQEDLRRAEFAASGDPATATEIRVEAGSCLSPRRLEPWP